jgi:hypothetical protein
MRLLSPVQPALRKLLVLLCLLMLGGHGRRQSQVRRPHPPPVRLLGRGALGATSRGHGNLIDPKVRDERPVTDLEFERYKQVQITSYHDKGASADLKAGTAVREIEIGVVNRYTPGRADGALPRSLALGRRSQDLVGDQRPCRTCGPA